MGENGFVTYREDEDETVFAVLSDRQVQCLGEQIAYQAARGVSSESDGLISPIGFHWLATLSYRWICR